jgi:hypothetical protein
MENKQVLLIIEELTSLKLTFNLDPNEFQKCSDIDNINLKYFEICNELNSFFLEKYLEGEEDFLIRIKFILEDGLNTWNDVLKNPFIIGFELENTNEKTNLTDQELLRIAEIKIFHISNLIENIAKLTEEPKTESSLKLSNRLSKVDLIRILNAMYELKYFQKTNGDLPHKKELMEAFGKFLNLDLSRNESDFSQALSSPLETNLKVFEQMKNAFQKIHYSKEK